MTYNKSQLMNKTNMLIWLSILNYFTLSYSVNQFCFLSRSQFEIPKFLNIFVRKKEHRQMIGLRPEVPAWKFSHRQTNSKLRSSGF